MPFTVTGGSTKSFANLDGRILTKFISAGYGKKKNNVDGFERECCNAMTAFYVYGDGEPFDRGGGGGGASSIYLRYVCGSRRIRACRYQTMGGKETPVTVFSQVLHTHKT